MLKCHKWDFGQCPVNAQPGVAGQHCQPGTVPGAGGPCPAVSPGLLQEGLGSGSAPAAPMPVFVLLVPALVPAPSCQGRPDEIWDIGNSYFPPLVLFLWVFYPSVGVGPLEEAEVLVILNKIQPLSARQIFPELLGTLKSVCSFPCSTGAL